jgi:hypothetical protein
MTVLLGLSIATVVMTPILLLQYKYRLVLAKISTRK